MADDDEQKNQDEYQFADLDVLGTEQETAALPEDEDLEEGTEGVASSPTRGRFDHIDPKILKTVQKGAIAVVALVLILMGYKMVSGFFSTKSDTKSTMTAASNAPKAKPVVKAPEPVVTKAPSSLLDSPSVSTAPVNKINTTDVSNLQTAQRQIESELSDLRTQVSTVNQNISDLSAKMADVQQTMLVLRERLEQQSEQMVRVQSIHRAKRTAAAKPAPRAAAPKSVYYIQAIIPGRAWLMSNEGSSLTVSRGSAVPGYGSVRLINAKIGRVFTSSGRVIQFSQADS
jgi:intracellular multiplication protein IcmG